MQAVGRASGLSCRSVGRWVSQEATSEKLNLNSACLQTEPTLAQEKHYSITELNKASTYDPFFTKKRSFESEISNGFNHGY